MAYDFRALSPVDFEDLVRALLQEELGLRLEAFARGRDQGIDLRFSESSDKKAVVQSKHYVDSGFSALKTAIKREAEKVKKIKPGRYILATSVPITPKRKEDLAKELRPFLISDSDILGPEDLNGLLTKHPKIERAFYKLWISSTNVLERILHNATFVSSEDEADRVARVVRLYVDTGSMKDALDILEKKHLLIVSGAPGVGKSTLARIIAWHFMASDWELVSVENFDQALAVFDKTKKQIFFFDDFMGQIRLSLSKIDQTDEKLLKFIERVQKGPQSFFVLTSREYILKQAQIESQKIADSRVDLRTYTIDVGTYHKAARAKILYNHIHFSEMSPEHKSAILNDSFYLTIIKHKNFSPRLIESLTSKDLTEVVPTDEYRDWVKKSLNNPTLLWQIPFRSHLSREGRTLVEAMFFLRDGVEIDELHSTFLRLHEAISARNRVALDTLDWARAVKETEGTFLNISNGRATFPNPSLRDFLDTELRGSTDVLDVLEIAVGSRKLERAIEFVLSNIEDFRGLGGTLTSSLRAAAKKLFETPLAVEHSWEDLQWTSPEGLSVADRLDLVLRIWACCNDETVAHIAEQIARQFPREGLRAVTFSQNIAPLGRLKMSSFEAFPNRGQIELSVKAHVFEDPYRNGDRPPISDMAEMRQFFDENSDPSFDDDVKRLIVAAKDAIDDIQFEIDQCSTVFEVNTLKGNVEAVAEIVGVDAARFDDQFEERIMEIESSESDDGDSPLEAASNAVERDESDAAINSLFSTLR